MFQLLVSSPKLFPSVGFPSVTLLSFSVWQPTFHSQFHYKDQEENRLPEIFC